MHWQLSSRSYLIGQETFSIEKGKEKKVQMENEEKRNFPDVLESNVF